MGARPTIRRSPSGARQQAGTLMPLAPCPAEGGPIGGCIPTIPASASHCSLRCGRSAQLTLVNLRRQPVNQPLPRIARSDLAGTRSAAPICPLPFWELSPKSGEPALTTKCSQQRPQLPSFPHVSATNLPQTSLLGTDSIPCTRVRHHIRPLGVDSPMRGARARAPLMHRGISSLTSSDSKVIRRTVTACCGLTRARRRGR